MPATQKTATKTSIKSAKAAVRDAGKRVREAVAAAPASTEEAPATGALALAIMAMSPKPRAGQVWSAASPKARSGRRYIRITEVRSRHTEDAYVNAVEITEDGSKPRRSKSSPFAREPLTSKLVAGGHMDPSYRFEPVLTDTLALVADEPEVARTTQLAIAKEKPAPRRAIKKALEEAVAEHVAKAPKPAKAKAAKAPRVSGQTGLAADPRLPKVGTTIEKKDRAGKVRCSCRVEADGIRYGGKLYHSLSAAAMAAAKHLGLSSGAINGFLFWGLTKPAAATKSK